MTRSKRLFLCSPVLALFTVAIMVAPGSALADFVVIFDDPTTGFIDYEIVDNGPLDLDDVDIDGFISIAISDGTLDVVATASSKPENGSATLPAMTMNVQALGYAGPMNVYVTDTDFNVADNSTTLPLILAILLEGSGGAVWDFFSDSQNREFEKDHEIATSEQVDPVKFSHHIWDLRGTAGPVGSLTMSAMFAEGSGPQYDLNTAYTQFILLYADGGGAPDIFSDGFESGSTSAWSSAVP